MIARDNVPPALLVEVKNYCNITWSDPGTDAKVCELIASGTYYLDKKIGGQPDYEADGTPRMLLMDWVRYGLSEALDVFETNFQAMILGEQDEGVLRAYGVESPTPAP